MKKTIRILSLLMAAVFVLTCGSGVLAQESKIEGPGYDSPEEALLAYAEALKAGDIDGMLSTFCVETYCENYEMEDYLEILTMASPGTSIYVSADGDPFLERLNREIRQDEIVDNIIRQVRSAALLGTDYEEFITNFRVEFTEETDAAGFLALLRDTTPFSTMSIGDIVTMEVLTGQSLKGNRLVQLTRARAGADELACSAVRLQIMGENWLLTMDAVRYGDKRYNMNSTGLLWNMLGIAMTTVDRKSVV